MSPIPVPDSIPVQECGGLGGAGNIALVPSLDPLEAVQVRHRDGTITGNAILKIDQGNKIIYELYDKPYLPPSVVFTATGSPKEVGDTFASVQWDGLITAGSELITDRTLLPDPGGVPDLSVPFNFTKTNVTRNTPGYGQPDGTPYTLTAEDEANTIVAKTIGPLFQFRYYMGFSSKTTLVEADVEALANNNIGQKLTSGIKDFWGGAKSYVIPVSPAGTKFIYWAYPVGTIGITGATLSGLPFPLYTGHPNVTVTNPFTVVTEYIILRSFNEFGATTLVITTS